MTDHSIAFSFILTKLPPTMSDVSPSAAAITHNLNPDNFHTTRKFVNPSPLRAYLSRKLPERRLLAKEEFTLNEVSVRIYWHYAF